MQKLSLLKRLTNRRQLLLSGLALAILLPRAIQAKEETTPLRVSSRHAKPAPPQKNVKRIVMIDPGYGGIDSSAVGSEGSEEACGAGDCQHRAPAVAGPSQY